MKFLQIALASFVAAASLSACAAPATPDATPRALTIYTSRSEALFKPVVEAFNKAHPGIKVQVLNGDNGPLLAKIREEAANPQADVFVNTDTISMVDAAAAGVFEKNDSKVVAGIAKDLRAEDGSWVALTLRPRVLMYNTNLVKKEDLPKSVFDLADPKWKGQVASTGSASGAMMANLAALRRIHGEAKVEALLKAMLANDTKWLGSSHTNVRNAVGKGEVKLGWVNHYYYYLSKAEGAPVGLLYVDEDQGLIVNSTNVGIVKGAKNAAAARLFVDFMLGTEGQQVFAEKNFEYPVVAGVALAPGVEPLTGKKLAPVTLRQMTDDLKQVQAMAQRVGLP